MINNDVPKASSVTQSRVLRGIRTQTKNSHLAATFRAASAGKGPRWNQEGDWGVKRHAIREKMGGEVHNTGRWCLTAPPQPSAAAAAFTDIRAAHLGPHRSGS